MSSVDWQRVKSVFHEVLERDGEARAALLGRLRREEPGLTQPAASRCVRAALPSERAEEGARAGCPKVPMTQPLVIAASTRFTMHQCV